MDAVVITTVIGRKLTLDIILELNKQLKLVAVPWMDLHAQGDSQATNVDQGMLKIRNLGLLGRLHKHNANQKGCDCVSPKKNSINVVEQVACMIIVWSGQVMAVLVSILY